MSRDATADAASQVKQPNAEETHPEDATSGDERMRAPRIQRVLDVPLAVTLRFGQRHLTLRDILALSTGSLVELDRQVEEPVDLVLGDRLIARGEVVIVDGNYGLRVTEVIEGVAKRIQRLHTAVQTDPVHPESEPA